MKKRLNYNLVEPKAYSAMDALDTFVSDSSIDKLQRELIKIRASQLNGCAYCVDAHSHDALNTGVPLQKVFLVSAWKEAGSIFTDDERLIFKMTEEITLIHQHGLSDETYEKAIEIFGEQKTAQIIIAIVTINAWNRISVSVKMHPHFKKNSFVTN